MISLLILVLIIGLIYWIAAQFLPPPFPTVILVIGAIIIIISLLQLVGNSSSSGDGINIDAVLPLLR